MVLAAASGLQTGPVKASLAPGFASNQHVGQSDYHNVQIPFHSVTVKPNLAKPLEICRSAELSKPLLPNELIARLFTSGHIFCECGSANHKGYKAYAINNAYASEGTHSSI